MAEPNPRFCCVPLTLGSSPHRHRHSSLCGCPWGARAARGRSGVASVSGSETNNVFRIPGCIQWLAGSGGLWQDWRFVQIRAPPRVLSSECVRSRYEASSGCRSLLHSRQAWPLHARLVWTLVRARSTPAVMTPRQMTTETVLRGDIRHMDPPYDQFALTVLCGRARKFWVSTGRCGQKREKRVTPI